MQLIRNIRAAASRYRARQRDKYILQHLAAASGTDTLAGNVVTFNSGESYLKQRNDIFYRKIYQFKTDNPQPRILDCGGNIGLSAIFFKQFYPKAHITVFEADPAIALICENNIRAFGFSQDIELVAKAVWTHATTLTFDARGGASSRIASGAELKHSIEIEAIDFNAYLEQEKEIDMLKIDIEGAEFELLQAVKNQLFKVKNIFVEFHSFKGQPQVLQNLLQIISDAGFRYYLESELSLAEKPLMGITTLDGFDAMILIFCYRP